MNNDEPGSRTFETILERRRKKRLRFALIALALLAIAAALFFGIPQEERPAPPAPIEPIVEWEPAPLPPLPRDPEIIEEVVIIERAIPAPTPLAALDESDAEVRLIANQLSPHVAWIEFLVGDSLIRRFVAIVDNIAQGSVPGRLMPEWAPEGPYRVIAEGDLIEVNPVNGTRYDILGRIASGIDARAAAALFRIWQPRIDQAYRELGYPDGPFSEVLLAAFRQLLAVPEIQGQPLLVPEGVGYAYADPELENLSASQKQLLRMGPENVLRVQEKLREIARHLGFSASQLPGATLYLTPPRD